MNEQHLKKECLYKNVRFHTVDIRQYDNAFSIQKTRYEHVMNKNILHIKVDDLLYLFNYLRIMMPNTRILSNKISLLSDILSIILFINKNDQINIELLKKNINGSKYDYNEILLKLYNFYYNMYDNRDTDFTQFKKHKLNALLGVSEDNNINKFYTFTIELRKYITEKIINIIDFSKLHKWWLLLHSLKDYNNQPNITFMNKQYNVSIILDRIFDGIFDIFTLLQDYYTIYRIFKTIFLYDNSNNTKNIISVLGYAHVLSILKYFFLKTDFKIISMVNENGQNTFFDTRLDKVPSMFKLYDDFLNNVPKMYNIGSVLPSFDMYGRIDFFANNFKYGGLIEYIKLYYETEKNLKKKYIDIKYIKPFLDSLQDNSF